MQVLESLTSLAWGWPTIGLFLLTGAYYSLRTGFFSLFGLREWWGATVGGRRGRARVRGGLSPMQTISTALAATIGTGSIAGVATALTFGGPGAVFWMWVSALLGMMTGWAEKALAISLRRRTADGWQGGPMLWLELAGLPGLAKLFAVAVVLASFGMGNLVQANSMAQALEGAFGVPPLVTGLAAAAVTGLALAGGVSRLGQICERLVPVMALGYLAGGLWVIVTHLSALPGALAAIVDGALGHEALFGGMGAAALQYGLARGVMTNEAGLGSTPLIHCSASNTDARTEGMWGIFEVFCSTLLVCTVTALAVLTSGVYRTGEGALTGAQLTAAAFSTVLGGWGGPFISLCLALFGFTTLLGWSWYGRCALTWLTGGRGERLYRAAFLLAVCAGSCLALRPVWQLADVFNALMAWPSLTALLLWSGRALRIFRGQAVEELPHTNRTAPPGHTDGEVMTDVPKEEARRSGERHTG